MVLSLSLSLTNPHPNSLSIIFSNPDTQVPLALFPSSPVPPSSSQGDTFYPIKAGYSLQRPHPDSPNMILSDPLAQIPTASFSQSPHPDYFSIILSTLNPGFHSMICPPHPLLTRHDFHDPLCHSPVQHPHSMILLHVSTPNNIILCTNKTPHFSHLHNND